jgi:arginine-tRNA-protein transferase
MNQSPAASLLRFFRTPGMPCPYLEGRQERLIFARLDGMQPAALHNVLAHAGFRRSHNIVYRPDCESCSACVPVRIRAKDFRATRSQRRVIAKNKELAASIVPAKASPDHFRQFARYQASRHADGSMADMDFDEYAAMVENTPVQTMLVEYRDAAGVLCGVGLTDHLKDGLSMVYSFFEPGQQRRSLGTFIILDHIRRAAAMGLDYVYLGYWIGESAKMSYKARFRPVEMLDRSGWRTFDPAGDHVQSRIEAEPDSEDEIAESANWRAWRFD